MNFTPLHEWQYEMQVEAGVQKGSPAWKNCFRKQRHATEALAQAAVRSMAKRFGTEQKIYHCDRCLGWHRYTV